MPAPPMPNFETIAQITLGWSISMSHPSNLRLAAKHLNLMAQDLAITAKPNIVDIEALRTLKWSPESRQKSPKFKLFT